LDKSAAEYTANSLTIEEGSASVTGADGLGARFISKGLVRPGAYGIGNAVVALIFSIAKREVTFLSGTAAISRL